MGRRPRPIAERFEVCPETGCHLWSGPYTHDGYGRASDTSAHRLMWVRAHGPIPDGLHIDHLCRVRHCVNVAHMELVTKAENTLRGISFAAVNARKSECANGHEFTPDNTYIRPNGHRDCRACIRARAASYQARRAA